MMLTLTDYIMLILIGIITVVDVWLIWVKMASISNRFREWGRQFAVPFFVWGILAGHFASDPHEVMFNSIPISVFVLLSFIIITGVFHRMMLLVLEFPTWALLLYVILGMPFGYYLWPIGVVAS